MARFGFLGFACCCVVFHLELVVAPPPPSVIEAYKPTTDLTTSSQDRNSGFGSLRDLRKTLTKLEHNIDDIIVRRKFMEEQMKSPFSIFPDRMEPAVKYTDFTTPSRVYYNRKIVSAYGVFLQIFGDGTLNGTKDDTSPYIKLTLEMVGINGLMLVKGEKSKKYLACTQSGKFQAVSKASDMTVFSSSLPPKPKVKQTARSERALGFWKSRNFVNLKCVKYNWFLGFRHNDKVKKGRHSRANQLSSWFILLNN